MHSYRPHSFSSAPRPVGAGSPAPRPRHASVLDAGEWRGGRWHGWLRTVADTQGLGSLLGRSMQGGEVVALYGDLGSGKTTLVRGLAKGLNVPSSMVSSPSFVLVHEYQGRVPLAHADLYRLASQDDVQHLGLSEYFDGRRVVAIEWADKAASELPQDRLEVHLTHHSPTTRAVVLNGTGPKAEHWLARLLSKSQGRRTGHRSKGPPHKP